MPGLSRICSVFCLAVAVGKPKPSPQIFRPRETRRSLDQACLTPLSLPPTLLTPPPLTPETSPGHLSSAHEHGYHPHDDFRVLASHKGYVAQRFHVFPSHVSDGLTFDATKDDDGIFHFDGNTINVLFHAVEDLQV